MSTSTRLLITALALATPLAAHAAPPPAPQEIARRALENTLFAANDARATVDLEITKDGAVVRKRQLTAMVKREAGKSRSFVEFHAPADVAGTRFLSVDEEGETKQFIYLPAFKKVKRIVGAQRSQSFVGTDFSYADLEGRNASDWTWRALPDEPVQGEATWVVEGQHKKADAPYVRMRVWVHQTHGIPLKTELFAAGGTTPEKRLVVNKLAKKDDRWVVVDSTMASPGKATATRLVVSALDTATPIPDAALSKEALER